jgi:hypothetical protein
MFPLIEIPIHGEMFAAAAPARKTFSARHKKGRAKASKNPKNKRREIIR